MCLVCRWEQVAPRSDRYVTTGCMDAHAQSWWTAHGNMYMCVCKHTRFLSNRLYSASERIKGGCSVWSPLKSLVGKHCQFLCNYLIVGLGNLLLALETCCWLRKPVVG